MAEAKFGYRHRQAGRHTRSKEESAVLQCCNSQMVRFVRAADLRAESDNVRRMENRIRQDKTALRITGPCYSYLSCRAVL